MISTTSQYALRALAQLDRDGDQAPLLSRDIAEQASIPRHFLSKILQILAQHGFVRSQKGPGGGFVLGQRAQAITVGQVIAAVDGPQRPETNCLLGHVECSVARACPLHEAWSGIRDQFYAKIGSLSVRDLSRIQHPSQ